MVTPIEKMGISVRKQLFKEFFEDVIYPQRMLQLGYRELTNQTAMVDTDGHLAQLIVSIVTGISGTGKKGKSNDELGDLSDGSEVKSGWRIDQKNDDEKEDAHPHFGNLATTAIPAKGAKSIEDFFSCGKLYVVFHSYTVSSHYKCEVLVVNLEDADVQETIRDWMGETSKKDLQPRLYPDNIRDKLATSKRSYKNLKAKVLARVIQTENNKAIVDLWRPPDSPYSTLELDECLKIKKDIRDALGTLPAKKTIDEDLFGKPEGAKKFFEDCIVRHRDALTRFCRLTQTTANLGYGFLAQHLVSMLVGVKGEDSKSNGDDLVGGGEIKEAFGYRYDESGALDTPRWNMGKKKSDMLGTSDTPWTRFIGVWFRSENNQLAVRVFEPEIAHFRVELKKWWDANPTGQNLQIHMRGGYNDTTTFSHSNKEENKVMEINCELRLHLEEEKSVRILYPDGD